MSASFNPKVMGSACTPWLRPIIGVILNRRAWAAMTPRSFFKSSAIMSIDALSWIESVVSKMSDDVSPW